ncbi:MAG: hypothetical protein ACE5HQ_10005 [Gemmatimonadota bacterium]
MRETRDAGHGTGAPGPAILTCLLVFGAAVVAAAAPGGPMSAAATAFTTVEATDGATVTHLKYGRPPPPECSPD